MRRKIFLHTIAMLCILPFALMVIRSVQGSGGGFSLIQYGLLLQSPRFFRAFWNSVVYTGIILFFNLPLSLLAAYAFSRFRFRHINLFPDSLVQNLNNGFFNVSCCTLHCRFANIT